MKQFVLVLCVLTTIVGISSCWTFSQPRQRYNNYFSHNHPRQRRGFLNGLEYGYPDLGYGVSPGGLTLEALNDLNGVFEIPHSPFVIPVEGLPSPVPEDPIEAPTEAPPLPLPPLLPATISLPALVPINISATLNIPGPALPQELPLTLPSPPPPPSSPTPTTVAPTATGDAQIIRALSIARPFIRTIPVIRSRPPSVYYTIRGPVYRSSGTNLLKRLFS